MSTSVNKCKCIYINADQLQNKLDELHFHFQCVTVDADFIFVTEVLPKYYPDNISYASMIYHIDGYKAFHSSDNGRRVIIYAKATYNISPNQYLNSKYHDATWCDWTVDHKTIILGCIYRSPSDIQSCESINHLLNEVSEISDNVLITGDFNYKDINWVISESEVLKHLKELDASKAMGPDKINPFLIKSIAEVFVKPLTLIFQKSVSSGIVPSAWKEAKITPRYKKGNKTEPSNYRPVTLTLEKLVRKSILSHLTENHLLSDKQYGFRSGRSCSLQLLNVMERWTEYDEQHQSWDTIYPGFALPIAIVAKCEEIINLAQKILIWRQLLAKEKSQVNFFVWRRNRHLRLEVIASCRLMVINVYLSCQLTPQLSTTQFSS